MEEYRVPTSERAPQLKLCLGVVCPVVLFMALINYSEQHFSLALVEGVVLVTLFLPPLLIPMRTMLRHPIYLDAGEGLLLTGAMIIFILLLIEGGVAGSGILWLPLFPFAAFHLRGIRRGWLWIALSTVLAIIVLIHEGSVYSTKQLWMFVPAYGFYVILAYLINSFRLQNAAMLDEKLRQRTARLEFLALHDELTNLYNRHGLTEQLKHLLNEPETPPLSVLLINCSRFQEINNLLGYENGNLLLKQMANRIETHGAASTGVAARLGADEFAVLLKGNNPFAMAAALKEELELPFSIGRDHIEIEVRMGMAHYPQHGHHAEDLLRHADVALRTARTLKKSPVIYDESQNPYSLRRLELFGQLRGAWQREELELHFQPKVDLATGCMIAAEALVRWNHPKEGMIPPGEFISIAEESGLVRPLSKWILARAFEQQQRWLDMGLNVSIAINLSVLDLTDPGFPNSVRALLNGFPTLARDITLEITESSFMEFPEIAQQVITQLGGMGFTISIDDYGTGYSSLSYLLELPVSEVKIDQCFVKKMSETEKSAAIVRSTIAMAHALNLRAVAEGVEDEKTANLLASMGCDLGQGYYFSRPVPAEELPKLYRQWANTPKRRPS
ncbi:MAG: bifunctional diguanylate cyclase/phosphodiesterase [Zetaproteobacteria bacterium]|nr:MAG: bifunctional diguanylate cyclase/phosphodiesterase [Zetaproteobacteria bacterium]